MQISIMGCGWLGTPLALHLQQQGHHVVASCRSTVKLTALAEQGISTYLYQLGDNLEKQEISDLFRSDLLILNIPPGGKLIQPTFYTEQMRLLIRTARQLGVKKLLFISTTAVYGDSQGQITERTPSAAATLSAEAHVHLERCASETFAKQACILRLAGLVGGKRHPAVHLAGKTGLSKPRQAVNLVHRQDVINAISQIIELDRFAKVFHLSAEDHPSRADYYQWACNKLGLTPPTFTPDVVPDKGKSVDASWTCEQLNLCLQYPSPYDMLN